MEIIFFLDIEEDKNKHCEDNASYEESAVFVGEVGFSRNFRTGKCEIEIAEDEVDCKGQCNEQVSMFTKKSIEGIRDDEKIG